MTVTNALSNVSKEFTVNHSIGISKPLSSTGKAMTA